MRRTLSKEEFRKQLFNIGFYIQKGDLSWRRKGDESLASVEAIDDICEFYNGLIQWFIIDGWRTGRGLQFDISLDASMLETTIRMRDCRNGKVLKSKKFKTSEVRRTEREHV